MRYLLTLLVTAGLALAQPVWMLTDAGDVSTVEAAQKTLDALAAKVRTEGGGIIIITEGPETWRPTNQYQEKRNKDASVTILDLRQGKMLWLPPPIGYDSRGTWTGWRLKRDLDLQPGSLPHWGTQTVGHVENNVISGAGSYYQTIPEPVTAGKNTRIYVRSVEGLFIGQFLNLMGQGREVIHVKDVKWDAEQRRYYVVADCENDHPAGVLLQNKHNTPAFQVATYSQADNQTFHFNARHHQYGVGDSFTVSGTHLYQGNVFSGGGDEGACVLNAESIHDLDGFHSEVEDFDAASGELTYAPGQVNARKLAQSRPIINMNEEKWITGGHVWIVPPHDWSGLVRQEDGSYTDWTGKVPVEPNYPFRGQVYPSLIEGGMNILGGLILASEDAPWTEAVVGRYFAVDEPTERYNPGDINRSGYQPAPADRVVRRWYRINSFTHNPDGTKSIRILRIRWAAVPAGAPHLFRHENYSWDGHERPLRYIIAPGAPPVDISDGWVDTRHTGYQVRPQHSRVIRLAENGDRGTDFDFAAGDPIIQAIGPDPWMPRGLRIRTFDQFPTVLDSPMIELAHKGNAQRVEGIGIGGRDWYASQVPDRKDQKPVYGSAINISAVSGVGLRLTGNTTEAAMLMEQREGNSQPIVWQHQGVTERTSIAVRPTDGTLEVSGGNVALGSTVNQVGVSGTAVAARNLRGIDVAVPAGATRVAVQFPAAEADAAYAITVQPSWQTQDWTTAKTATGFTVEFSEAAPANARIDWHLIR